MAYSYSDNLKLKKFKNCLSSAWSFVQKKFLKFNFKTSINIIPQNQKKCKFSTKQTVNYPQNTICRMAVYQQHNISGIFLNYLIIIPFGNIRWNMSHFWWKNQQFTAIFKHYFPNCCRTIHFLIIPTIFQQY